MHLEVWQDIPGYEGVYQASDMGRIRGIDRFDSSGKFRTGKVLKQRTNKHGYKQLVLSKNGIVRTHIVHVIICTVFNGHKPDNHEVSHKNGIKTDNRKDNVYWKTHAENERDKILHGTIPKGDRNGKYTKPNKTPRGERIGTSKLSVEDILKIRSLHRDGLGCIRISKIFGVSKTSILNIINRKTWNHI